MNNTFSLQQTSRTSTFDANLINRKYKLNLLADLMQIKSENPKLKQPGLADRLGYSFSTLQRYRNDINMLSPYRIQSNKRTKGASNTKFDNDSHGEHDFKRSQLTSNNLKTIKTKTKSNNRNKNVLKAGSVHENIEINKHYIVEFLDNNDI